MPAVLTRCAVRRAARPYAPDFLVAPDLPCYYTLPFTSCVTQTSMTVSDSLVTADKGMVPGQLLRSALLLGI
jgi:hypothetical protein